MTTKDQVNKASRYARLDMLQNRIGLIVNRAVGQRLKNSILVPEKLFSIISGCRCLG